MRPWVHGWVQWYIGGAMVGPISCGLSKLSGPSPVVAVVYNINIQCNYHSWPKSVFDFSIMTYPIWLLLPIHTQGYCITCRAPHFMWSLDFAPGICTVDS